VDPARAFEIFTRGFDRWWPKKLPADPRKTLPGGAPSPVEESRIEPFEGGRWYSRCEDGSETDIGHVLAWEPGRRLLLSWEFDAQWRPDATAASEVEVKFIPEGSNSTRVELEHRNFERMGRGRRPKDARGCRGRLADPPGALRQGSRRTSGLSASAAP
jgi:Activator of Hsp90 ATPase homolog 1-like protein.